MRKNNKTFTLDLKVISPYIPAFVFTLLFLVGLLIGCLCVGKYSGLTEGSAAYLKEYYELRNSDGFFLRFKDSVLTYFPIYVIMFLLGASVIGCVTSPALLIYEGFAYGCIASYLYSVYGLVGIMFCALVVLPGMLVCSFGLIFLAKEAFGFAKVLCEVCIRNAKPVNIYTSFRTYCVKCGTLFICAFLAVLLDVGMSSIFLRYFSL